MSGLVPGIHVLECMYSKTWMAGTSPAMTIIGQSSGMLDGFKRSDLKTKGARIVTVVGGSGPPLLLMHGNPFNHLSWLKVAPRLAKDFTVVATDLRGYGDSEKPPGGFSESP